MTACIHIYMQICVSEYIHIEVLICMCVCDAFFYKTFFFFKYSQIREPFQRKQSCKAALDTTALFAFLVSECI